MIILKSSCWNCHRSVGYRTREIAQTRWQPGEPAMIEDCTSQNGAGSWEQWEEDYEVNQCGHDELEEYFAYRCPDYLPEKFKCQQCGKETTMDKAVSLHDLYDFVYTCSYTCATLMDIKIKKEYEEHEDYCCDPKY